MFFFPQTFSILVPFLFTWSIFAFEEKLKKIDGLIILEECKESQEIQPMICVLKMHMNKTTAWAYQNWLGRFVIKFKLWCQGRRMKAFVQFTYWPIVAILLLIDWAGAYGLVVAVNYANYVKCHFDCSGLLSEIFRWFLIVLLTSLYVDRSVRFSSIITGSGFRSSISHRKPRSQTVIVNQLRKWEGNI